MRRPLLWAGISLVVGAWTPTDRPLSCWAGIALAALTGTFLLALASSRRTLLWLTPALLLLGFFAGGKAIAQSARCAPPDSLSSLLAQFQEVFESGAEVAGRVVVWERRLDSADHLILEMEEVRLVGVVHPVRGRVRLQLPQVVDQAEGFIAPRWVRGDRLALFARIRPPQARAQSREEAIGQIKSMRLVALDPVAGPDRNEPAIALLRALDHVRDTAVRRIQAPFPGNQEGRRGAAVALSLVLGERADLDPNDLSLLREAGLSHLLAVSGFNVAVLTATLLFCFKGIRLPFRVAQVATIPLLLGYLALNREESSVVRAVAMAALWLAGRSLWRRAEPLNLLGVAAIWILFRDPGEVHDLGFQLTFLATASLIVLTPPLLTLTRLGTGQGRLLFKHLRLAAVVTLAALLGTLPLTVSHFHRISPGAFPANLVAGPLMAGAFVASLALPLIPPSCDPVAELAAWAITGMVEAVFRAAAHIVSLPGSGWARPDPSPWSLFLYAAGLVSFTFDAGAASRWKRTVLALRLAGVTGLLWIVTPLDSSRPPEGLRVTALDVGQGDAILIESPAGARVLVDAGRRSQEGFDAGERLVAPALWRRGITSIDLLVVTHADADHAGGAAAIIRLFRPSHVWKPAGSRDPVKGFERLLDAAREGRVPIEPVARGNGLCLPGMCLSVLNPEVSADGFSLGSNVNENSLVLSVRAHGREALLMADSGVQTEQRLLDTRDTLGLMSRVDVLKVGHHGSRTSSSKAFLGRVRPRIALLSCGRRNRFGHPHPAALSNLAAAGARVCRTDTHGEVGVELLRNATRLPPSCIRRE